MGKAEKRTYLILAATRHDTAAPGASATYQEQGEVEASGAEAAIREWAKTGCEPGVYVAVTKRSWYEVKVGFREEPRVEIGEPLR